MYKNENRNGKLEVMVPQGEKSEQEGDERRGSRSREAISSPQSQMEASCKLSRHGNAARYERQW